MNAEAAEASVMQSRDESRKYTVGEQRVILPTDMTSTCGVFDVALQRKRLRRLGWLWLLAFPFLTFLLFQLLRSLSLQSDVSVVARLSVQEHLVDDSMRLLHFVSTPSRPTEHVTSLSRLHYFERQVTDSYLHVELALAASSGSLFPLKGKPLADVGTLNNLHTFQPLLTPREKARLLYALELFSTTCQSNGLTFFLLDNSLVGSVRHHGIIPWSDFSITVGMHAKDQPTVLTIFDKMEGVMLMYPNPYSWSFSLQHTRPDPPDLLRMTLIKIQFYQENATHLWAETWGNKRQFTAARQQVFPLTLRPFEGQLTPVPCNVKSVLEGRDINICRAVLEDGEEMVFRDAGVQECHILSQVFPFVTRRLAMTSWSTLEQVLVNGTLLYSALVDTGCTAEVKSGRLFY